MNHWAIPRPIWKAMEEEKEEEKRGRIMKKDRQQQLSFKTPMLKGQQTEFTRAGTLHVITKLIVTNNQVSHQLQVIMVNSTHTALIACR
jgi:hypothetical protein